MFEEFQIDGNGVRFSFCFAELNDVRYSVEEDVINVYDDSFYMENSYSRAGSHFRRAFLHCSARSTFWPYENTILVGIISPKTKKKMVFFNGLRLYPFDQRIYDQKFYGYTYPNFKPTSIIMFVRPMFVRPR